MGSMALTEAFDIVFAAAIGVAALALAGAAMRFLPRIALVALTSIEAAAAVVAWLAFALRHSHPRELAIAAGGLTGCILATAAALALRQVLGRTEEMNEQFADAKARLYALI